MGKECPSKIDIVKVQLVRDRTLDYGKKVVRGPADLAELGWEVIGNSDREIVLLICLDARKRPNCIHVVSIGTATTSFISPPEVLRTAILSNADSIALAHCHPSGDTEPSEQDIQITTRLAECAKLFDIELLDHVIIADNGSYESLFAKGLIRADRQSS